MKKLYGIPEEIFKMISTYIIIISLVQIIFGYFIGKNMMNYLNEERKLEFENAIEAFIDNEKLVHYSIITGYAWWDELGKAIKNSDFEYVYDNWIDSTFVENFDIVQLFGKDKKFIYFSYDGKEYLDKNDFNQINDPEKDRKLFEIVNNGAKKYLQNPNIDLSQDIEKPLMWAFFEKYNEKTYFLTLSPICANNGIPMVEGYMLVGIRIDNLFEKIEKVVPANLEFDVNLENNYLGYMTYDYYTTNKSFHIGYQPIRDFGEVIKNIFIGVIFLNIFLSTIIFSLLGPKFNKKSKKNLENLIELKTEELQEANYELKEINTQINEYSEKIKNLLDNSDQGFLTINKECKIESEYSTECENILGRGISGKNVQDTLFAKEEVEERETIENIFAAIFKKNISQNKKRVLLTLLPKDIKINGQNIEILYKLINSKGNYKMMLILTDITEKVNLQKRMENEREKLLMIVKIIRNLEEFKKSVQNALTYFKSDIFYEISEINKARIFETFRKVHTYKGDFSQWRMEEVADKINELEDYLVKIKKDRDICAPSTIAAFIINLNIPQEILNSCKIVEESVGKNIINLESENSIIVVDKTKLINLEDKIRKLFDPEICKPVLADIRNLRYKKIEDFFEIYKEYADRILKNIGKMEIIFKIKSNEILINEDVYYNLFKSFIHIIRNIIDHGIEENQRRIELGKTEKGTIDIETDVKERKLIISIKDDGRGLDFEKIKSRILVNGVLSKKYLDSLSDYDIGQFIFMNEISTKTSVTNLSGRGVGLSAVKDEVEKLHGTIEVFSSTNIGTTIVIRVPFLDE